MATLDAVSDAVTTLTGGAIQDPTVALGVAGLMSAPLILVVLGTVAQQIAVMSTERALAVMTLLGLVGATGQFFASSRFENLNRRINAVEILFPMALIFGFTFLVLGSFLPPSPGNDALRAFLESTGLAASTG